MLIQIENNYENNSSLDVITYTLLACFLYFPALSINYYLEYLTDFLFLMDGSLPI